MRLIDMTLLGAVLLAGPRLEAQSQAPELYEIDECGTLSRGSGCILFEAAGGKYVIPEAAGFHVGDAVRVVGTLDPGCVTICPEADGCIRGATLYDPAVWPCGTELPNFPADILSGICEATSAVLLGAVAAGLWWSRRR